MRKHRRNLLLGALLVLSSLGALVWLTLRPREPVYGGKTLSSWLQIYYSTWLVGASNVDQRFSAENAIREMGTNAIPTLLRLLRAKDSPVKFKMMQLFARQRAMKSPFVPAAEKNVEAFYGFIILGAEARSAVPDLIGIFDENISEYSRMEAADALGVIGPDAKPAVPTLLSYVTDTNSLVNTKRFTIMALGRIHSDPQAVLPVMLDCLKDARPATQRAAAEAIKNFGPTARPAVPALVELLKNQDPNVRLNAGQTLKAIDPEAAAKAGIQ